MDFQEFFMSCALAYMYLHHSNKYLNYTRVTFSHRIVFPVKIKIPN
jgi:hypothetical protein